MNYIVIAKLLPWQLNYLGILYCIQSGISDADIETFETIDTDSEIFEFNL